MQISLKLGNNRARIRIPIFENFQTAWVPGTDLLSTGQPAANSSKLVKLFALFWISISSSGNSPVTRTYESSPQNKTHSLNKKILDLRINHLTNQAIRFAPIDKPGVKRRPEFIFMFGFDHQASTSPPAFAIIFNTDNIRLPLHRCLDIDASAVDRNRSRRGAD